MIRYCINGNVVIGMYLMVMWRCRQEVKLLRRCSGVSGKGGLVIRSFWHERFGDMELLA
jgi:hypothetical protein